MGNNSLWADEAVTKVVDLFSEELSTEPNIAFKSTTRKSTMTISTHENGNRYSFTIRFDGLYIPEDTLMEECTSMIEQIKDEQMDTIVTDVNIA